MQGFRKISIAGLLLLPLAVFAAETDWELKRDCDFWPMLLGDRTRTHSP